MLRRTTALALALTTFSAYAQISTGSKPYGLRAGLPTVDVPSIHAMPFDAQAVALEDAAREAAGRVPAYARLLPLHAALGDDGQWTTLANGDGIWRIRVVSTGALATELYFSDFFLPEEAELHVYTADGSQILGGFTAFNNREDGSFATSIIPGESCLVEYHEPA